MSTKKIEYAIKHNSFLQKLYVAFGSLLIRFLGIFIRQNKKMILFSSFGGKKFNDSPKLIYDYINSRYKGEYVCVWAFLDPNSFPDLNCKKIKINSLKYFVYAQRSKYWVTNVNIERGLHFQKKTTVYLNTWHGVCLDYIGNDRPGRKDYNFKKLNYMCVSSSFDERIYKTAFNTSDNQYLKCGMPRNDCLVNREYKTDDVKKELGLPLNKKIILYAPTWREDFKRKIDYEFESQLNINNWKSIFEDEYIVLFRAHSITKKVSNIVFDDFCRDVTFYPDTNKLLSIVDILISDFSSILIDYSILERPIFNFANDYDLFLKTHGFYVDYEKEMTNGIISNEAELIDRLKNIDFDQEKIKTKALKEKYAIYSNGHATEECVKKLLGK